MASRAIQGNALASDHVTVRPLIAPPADADRTGPGNVIEMLDESLFGSVPCEVRSILCIWDADTATT